MFSKELKQINIDLNKLIQNKLINIKYVENI